MAISKSTLPTLWKNSRFLGTKIVLQWRSLTQKSAETSLLLFYTLLVLSTLHILWKEISFMFQIITTTSKQNLDIYDIQQLGIAKANIASLILTTP